MYFSDLHLKGNDPRSQSIYICQIDCPYRVKTEGSIIVFSPEDVDGDAEEDDEDEPDDDQSEHPVAQDPAI